MNTNKKISINSLITTLLANNIIPVLIICLITVSTSFIYNMNFKKISYSYSINILSHNIWVSDKTIISEKIVPANYTSYFIHKYLDEYPANVVNKKFSNEEGSINISFKSLGTNLNVSNFLSELNSETKKSVLIKLNNKYEEISRKQINQKNLNISDVSKNLEDYPLVLKIKKIEQALNKQYDIDKRNTKYNIELAELGYFINNFEILFNSNMFISLNGWKIKSNDHSTNEIIFAGLLFGFLLSFILLFFKSNYFRKLLSN